MAALALAGSMAGCAGTPRTTVEPPSTEASEHLASQRPGVVERLTVVIEPALAGAGSGKRLDGATVPTGDAPQAGTPAATPRRKSPTGDGASQAETLRAAIEAAQRAASETGTRVTVDWSRQVDPSADTQTRTLTDRGVGLDQVGREQDANLDQRGRTLSLPWGGQARPTASGGGFGLDWSVVGGMGVNVLHLLGGLCIVLAVIPIAFPPRRIGLAAAIAGTGLVLIACGTVAAEYPWLFAVALVAFGLMLAWLAYDAWRSSRAKAALKAIVPVVEDAPSNVSLTDGIKANAIDNGTARAVKDEVTRIKREVGIE